MKDESVYLDADILIALVRPKDRFKVSAEKWLRAQTEKETSLVTSSITALELWFYYYKNGFHKESLEAVRALSKICTVVPIDFHDIEAGLVLAEQHSLSPADAVHATLGLRHGAIVSTDHAFDRVQGLKRIDFSKD